MADIVSMVKKDETNGIDKILAGTRGLALEPRRMGTSTKHEAFRAIPSGCNSEKLRGNNTELSRSKTWSSITSVLGDTHASCTSSDTSAAKRCFGLQLPPFKSLGISPFDPAVPLQYGDLLQSRHPQNTIQQLQSSTSNQVAAASHQVMLPLTPPLDDTPAIKLHHQIGIIQSSGNFYSSTQSNENRRRTENQEPTSGTAQDHGLSESSDPSGSMDMSSWVLRASHTILTSLNITSSGDSIHLVSQILPSQAKGSGFQPTFEDVLGFLQANMNTVPYITITHAVPQATLMEELPKTPPSTPNLRHHANDYFDNDQTIFTHAAVVPIHHTHDRVQMSVAAKLAHHIAAPGSTQFSILERYIPPTMPEEIDDFFSLSSRSYLVDRLSELSANNGSLLLIYPTRNGGDTFAKQYIGPVIDPYLRQFVMLNSLTSDVAALMGKMTAVTSMIDFTEMKDRITALCKGLATRLASRGRQSTFTMTHSEIANVVLDRATWMSWYVDQEQSRLRQNLVEYHQSGGRMPASEGHREITVGMLARDFIDGFQKSQEAASDAEIEVGVFVVTRSMLP